MWEMACEFDKRLKHVGNSVSLWGMAFDKRLKNLGNDVDMHKMAKICGEMA